MLLEIAEGTEGVGLAESILGLPGDRQGLQVGGLSPRKPVSANLEVTDSSNGIGLADSAPQLLVDGQGLLIGLLRLR